MGGLPTSSIFDRQRPIQCARCGHAGAPVPTGNGACCAACGTGVQPPSDVTPNGYDNDGNGSQMHQSQPGAAPGRPRPGGLPSSTSWLTAPGPGYGAQCPPIGAPFPCIPYMDPRKPDQVYGHQLPCNKMNCAGIEEAVKQLCWVETSLRSIADVASGDTIVFSIEVKWWFQIQKIVNAGDQVSATFDLTNIGYGQSNYNLEILELMIDGVDVPQNGIDIRRWNFGNFEDKFYPFPAMGLNDPVELEFTNVSGDDQAIELIVGGPAVLQIG